MMLNKIRQLYTLLDDNSIQHVTWKSLENLEDALNAVDDVDLLCNPNDKQKITSLLQVNGFIEDIYSLGCVYEDITVFRGFDHQECKFIMLHLHYALRVGGKKYKEYRFPFEQEVLDNTQIKLNTIILKDCYFIVTRLLQVTVKKAYQDVYTLELCQQYFELPEQERVIARKYLQMYFDIDADVLMKDVLENGLAVLNKYYAQVCRQFNMLSSVDEAKLKVDNHKQKKGLRYYWIPLLIRRKRNKLYQAISIVLAGHDGSGKTSTSTKIVETLKAECSVKRVYLGRNKWSKINTLINKYRDKNKFSPLRFLWPISSTLEIIIRFISGQIFKSLGYVVIYDRSLDDLYLKYQDKHLLYAWFPILSFKLLSLIKLDYKFLLIADSDIVLKRKGAHDLGEIDQLRKHYLDTLKDFDVVDTSNKTILETTGNIIKQSFFS
jgi:thymidylate kinase